MVIPFQAQFGLTGYLVAVRLCKLEAAEISTSCGKYILYLTFHSPFHTIRPKTLLETTDISLSIKMSATMTGVKNGVVIDISGLSFRVGDVDGVVSTSGEFYYQTNQEIAFGIGALQLGSMIGQDVVTFLDLAAAHSKTPPSIDDPGLINRVRLLLSLTDGQGFEKKIVITEKVCKVLLLIRSTPRKKLIAQ